MSLQELKTEEGYSADIVRTYITGDICPHNTRTISHNISRRIYVSRGRCCADIVRTLCRHSADIVRHNVRTISFFGFQLYYCVFPFSLQLVREGVRNTNKFHEKILNNTISSKENNIIFISELIYLYI